MGTFGVEGPFIAIVQLSCLVQKSHCLSNLDDAM